MDIRNTKRIQKAAANRIENAAGEKKVAAVYAGVAIGINFLVAMVGYVLGLQIDRSGGLSKMGLRSILASIQTMLPIVQTLVIMCMEIGYQAAMLRISRGQYTSPNTLRLGFGRFWVVLRQQALLSLIYMGIAMAAVYVSSMIYALTPLSRPAVEILTPLLSQISILNSELVLDDAMYAQLVSTMVPAFVILGLLFIALYIPVAFRYRMAAYVLIDKPELGALATLRQSKAMMRGNVKNLLKLDLHLWWYYAVSFLITMVCYGDQLLPLVGLELPFHPDVSYFLFYGLYWAMQFALIYFLRGRVEVCYALAYEAIKPEEKKPEGVVLGNIFQM